MLLIVDNEPRMGESLAAAFSYMGIIAYSARPRDTFSELCQPYRAVLIKSPEHLPDTEDFLKRIRKYNSDIPVFAFSDNAELCNRYSFKGVFPLSTTVCRIADGINSACKSEAGGKNILGDYSLAGISSSKSNSKIDYFYRQLTLTAKERMILNFLILSYPVPKSSSEILKYAFTPSRRPELSAVRTHISSINKVFASADERKLICHIRDSGYIILTPQIAESEKLFSAV